jgi:hypothetical protein
MDFNHFDLDAVNGRDALTVEQLEIFILRIEL